MPPAAHRMELTLDSRLPLRPLSVVADGDEFVVGDAGSGVFVALPEVGVIALRALQEGRTLAEARVRASEHAGEDVDILAFAQGLADAGFADDSLQSEWHDARGARLGRVLFSRPAWSLYVLLALACGVLLAVRPRLRPSVDDVFFTEDPLACVAAAGAAAIVLTGAHEACHWLAARAAGVGASFRVTRRQFVVVLEADLTRLWTLERHRRYSPLLAGMAFDIAVLAAVLALRLAGVAERPAALVAVLEVLALGFQVLLFLRTDLYAVLATALGCRNLWRINLLVLKQRARLLSSREREELAAGHPRDIAVARWFCVLYAAGSLWMAWVLVTLFVPGTVRVWRWAAEGLASAPVGSLRFVEALALAALATLRSGVLVALLAREGLKLARRRADTPIATCGRFSDSSV